MVTARQYPTTQFTPRRRCHHRLRLRGISFLMNRLESKVAIVTGAGRGIGRAVANMFAAEGATVIATSQSPHADFALGIQFVQQDVAESAGWDSLVAGVLAEHGRVDVLVNNAGIIAYEPLHELSS